jgi:hypothetical protein
MSDDFALYVIPDGADKELPRFTEADAEITDADIRRAIRLFNQIMPVYWVGILEARTVAAPKESKETIGPAGLV